MARMAHTRKMTRMTMPTIKAASIPENQAYSTVYLNWSRLLHAVLYLTVSQSSSKVADKSVFELAVGAVGRLLAVYVRPQLVAVQGHGVVDDAGDVAQLKMCMGIESKE